MTRSGERRWSWNRRSATPTQLLQPPKPWTDLQRRAGRQVSFRHATACVPSPGPEFSLSSNSPPKQSDDHKIRLLGLEPSPAFQALLTGRPLPLLHMALDKAGPGTSCHIPAKMGKSTKAQTCCRAPCFQDKLLNRKSVHTEQTEWSSIFPGHTLFHPI